MVIVVFFCLVALGGFILGVTVTNAEHRRNAQWGSPQPTALPVVAPSDNPRDFYPSQRPAAAAPVSLTVNVHTAPAPVAPQREYVLNGEVVPALTERLG